MSRAERLRRRLEVLRRRVQHLEGRIEVAEAAGRSASYDQAEVSALKWVIGLGEAEVARIVGGAQDHQEHEDHVGDLLNDAKGG